MLHSKAALFQTFFLVQE